MIATVPRTIQRRLAVLALALNFRACSTAPMDSFHEPRGISLRSTHQPVDEQGLPRAFSAAQSKHSHNHGHEREHEKDEQDGQTGHKCAHDSTSEEYLLGITTTPQLYHFMRGAGTLSEQEQRVAPTFERKRLRQWEQAEDMKWSPIRFHLDTSLMQSTSSDANYTCNPSQTGDIAYDRYGTKINCNAGSYGLSNAARQQLLNVLLPRAKAWVQQALSVEPVKGNLVVTNKNSPYGSGIPGLSNGKRQVANTDMLLVVTARPIIGGGSTLATGASIEFDSFNRPIVGHLNFNPEQSSTYASTSKLESNLGTAVHEIMHSLGLGAGGFTKMVDEELNPRGGVVTEVSAIKNYRKRTYLTSPRVRQAVRRQFNCSKSRGAELENDGSSTGSQGSHWEKRIFMDETMNPQAVLNPLVTEVTFAYFEDSGHYRANYSAVSVSEWGLHLGCGFDGSDNSDCSSWSSLPNAAQAYSVTSSTPSPLCSFDRKSKAFVASSIVQATSQTPSYYNHGGFTRSSDKYADRCPIASTNTQSMCLNVVPSSSGTYPTESKHASSRCFLATLLAAKYVQQNRVKAFCFQHTCSNGVLSVTVGSQTVTCPSGGGSKSVSGFTGTFTCPSYKSFCGPEESAAAFGAKLRDPTDLVFRSVVPQQGGTGGGTHIRIYGQGFKTGAAPAVTIGGQAATGVKVITNTELLATSPAHGAADADVVLSSGARRDAGYGAFAYSSSFPDGDAKDSLPKLTLGNKVQGASNVALKAGSATYKIDRQGHGAAAGAVGAIVLQVKQALNYNSVNAQIRDGSAATRRHHDSTIPDTNKYLYGGSNVAVHAIGGSGSCGTGDGNTYVSVAKHPTYNDATLGIATFTLQTVDAATVTTLSSGQKTGELTPLQTTARGSCTVPLRKA